LLDNVTPDGGLVENKACVVSSGGRLQLSNYLAYLDEHGGSLVYNFFRHSVGGDAGPTPQFATMLRDAATNRDVSIHFYNYDWWEELQ
jgi:hypothetical protein